MRTVLLVVLVALFVCVFSKNVVTLDKKPCPKIFYRCAAPKCAANEVAKQNIVDGCRVGCPRCVKQAEESADAEFWGLIAGIAIKAVMKKKNKPQSDLSFIASAVSNEINHAKVKEYKLKKVASALTKVTAGLQILSDLGCDMLCIRCQMNCRSLPSAKAGICSRACMH
jgi:hypothetical protein